MSGRFARARRTLAATRPRGLAVGRPTCGCLERRLAARLTASSQGRPRSTQGAGETIRSAGSPPRRRLRRTVNSFEVPMSDVDERDRLAGDDVLEGAPPRTRIGKALRRRPVAVAAAV